MVVTVADDKTKVFSAMRARTQENIARQKAEEYTPTTDSIREGYAFTVQSKIAGATFGQGLAEFDRWLAAHDAEVARKALTDAAETFMARLPDGTGNGRAYNSHTVAEMLRARAEQIAVLIAAFRHGTDTDTHWANGLPRLLTPEAYNRLSAQRLAKQAALAESNEAGS